MNTLIHFKKSLALLSLLALVAVPIGVLAVMYYYGAPITINNPTPAVDDHFGISVAIDGDKFIVGTPRDDTGSTDAGSAYLYDATTGALLQTFNNPTPVTEGFFGWSVSLSGNKVLIGSIKNYTGGYVAGSAYLYDAITGVLLHTFNNPTPAESDLFGVSVSLSGDKALIGAIFDDTGAIDAGSAYLFDATTGALLHTFNNPTPEYGERFGASISISGDKVLIGAHDNTGAIYAGSAYLYDATTTGALLQTFNNPTPAAYDYFGNSVSISSNRVLIGAIGDDTGAVVAGSAYLFDATTGALLQTLNNPTPESDQFGNSVSISGDKALVGAVYDDAGAVDAGSAYLFDATTGVLLHTFNNPTPTVNESFGASVYISGYKILVGAHRDDTGADQAGSVYLYLLQTDTDDDGVADSADNCPADVNADQTDTDGDGQGNPCDPTPYGGDPDNDGIGELLDNCLDVYNPDQQDTDSDGIGNVCDPTPDGDPDPNPTSTDQCKQLGWMDFGFHNQGQCVAFVNTGHDSR